MTVLQVIGAGILWVVCVGAGAALEASFGPAPRWRPYWGRDAAHGALWGAVFATYVAAIALGFALLIGAKP